MNETYFVIALTSLVLGCSAGIVMYRSDFCVTAMFRDIFLFKKVTMLRYLVVMIILTMGLFELAKLLGVIRIYPFPLLGTPSLATLLASILFGVGMVLAGGCVVGTLYKMGSGSMLSLVAFIGLISGSAFYAEFHSLWAEFAKATQFSDKVTLSQSLALDPLWLILPVIIIGSIVIKNWYSAGLLKEQAFTDGYLQPLHTAVILSVIGFISYVIIGMPLGITTSYAKMGASVEALFDPGHVEQLKYFSAMPLNYIPPFSNTVVTGGAGPALDGIAAIQYPLVIGITAGAFLYSKKIGEFRIYYRMPIAQYISALSGGFIVGMAARMVPGCNIWHLWGGVPIFANQSLLFLLGLFPGAWLGNKLLTTFVMKNE